MKMNRKEYSMIKLKSLINDEILKEKLDKIEETPNEFRTIIDLFKSDT